MITLILSTSFSQFKVLISKNDEILFNSEKLNDDANTKEIATILSEGLKIANIDGSQINQIIVDRGPGGTSATRSGVALANSLAYSLKIPIYSISSVEIMCLKIWEKYKFPVICTVKSINDSAFIGHYEAFNKFSLTYGKIKEIVPQLISNHESISIVGQHNELLKELLTTTTIHEEKLDYCDVVFMNQNRDYIISNDKTINNLVLPITENNIN